MEMGQPIAVRMLVAARANLDAQDQMHWTVLHFACMYANDNDLGNTMAEILVSAGANVHSMDMQRLFDWFRL